MRKRSAKAILGLAAISVVLAAGSSAAGKSARMTRFRAQTSAAVSPCPGYCPQSGAPLPLAVTARRGGSLELELLPRASGQIELILSRLRDARLRKVEPALVSSSPRDVLAGSVPDPARPRILSVVRLPRVPSGTERVSVELPGMRERMSPGVYKLRLDLLDHSGRVRAVGGAVVVRVKTGRHLEALLEPRDLRPPAVAGEADASARSGLDADTATVAGRVDPNGLQTEDYVEYGTGPSLGRASPLEVAGTTTRDVKVSAALSGLGGSTTYDYRFVASQCGGCAWGTAYGPEHRITTPATVQAVNSARAIATFAAMEQYFWAASVHPGDTSDLFLPTSELSSSSSGSSSGESFGQSSGDGLNSSSDSGSGSGSGTTGTSEYTGLWPYSRALAGTITLAAIPSVRSEAGYQSALQDQLVGLSRYWDTSTSPAGYNGLPMAPDGSGGSLFYDDSGWIGLDAVSAYRLFGSQTALADAENASAFDWPGGSGMTAEFEPGGEWWTQQGVNDGTTNHDRTTTATLSNAELLLLLADLDPPAAATDEAAAVKLYDWANHYLYNVKDDALEKSPNPNYEASQPALMLDEVKGNDKILKAHWAYDQGAMIAASVREYQLSGERSYLKVAQAIASTALAKFNERYYLDHTAAFNAIFFCDLLVLYAADSATELRQEILKAIETYANDAWTHYRNAEGLFRFPSSVAGGDQLIDEASMLQIFAALAWKPASWDELP